MINRSINISGRKIGDGQPVFIVAEAGVNHNGSMTLAKKMIDAAKAAGADAVKFQTFKAEELATKRAPKAGYQKKRVKGKSHYEMLKELELSAEDFKQLSYYSSRKKIIFLSTPFDALSADLLDKIGMPAFKISSGEITNLPLLCRIAHFGKPIILSTGMASLSEVKNAVKAIFSLGNKKLILLHCTSSYPTRYEDVNLLAMKTLRKTFNVPVGYSDHTPGLETPVAAAALGAVVIEKHFTLDKKLEGPDHRASLSPEEFRKMVKTIRNIEKALGDGIKAPRKTEMAVQAVARKSIVALRNVSKGTQLSAEMLTIKRPGTGISPKYLNELTKRRAKTNIKRDQVITWDKIE